MSVDELLQLYLFLFGHGVEEFLCMFDEFGFPTYGIGPQLYFHLFFFPQLSDDFIDFDEKHHHYRKAYYQENPLESRTFEIISHIAASIKQIAKIPKFFKRNKLFNNRSTKATRIFLTAYFLFIPTKRQSRKMKRRKNLSKHRSGLSKRRFDKTLKDNIVLKVISALRKKEIDDCDVFSILVLRYCDFFVPLPP